MRLSVQERTHTITRAMGNRSIPIANNFAADKQNFRKRILIMSKKRSSKKTMLIALCSIPAVALAGTALSMPVTSRFLSEISDYSFRKESLSEEKLRRVTRNLWLKLFDFLLKQSSQIKTQK